MPRPTSEEIFNNIIFTTIATASSATNYSYRPRTTIKPPTPFPVSLSPSHQRSKKSTTKTYKPTPATPLPSHPPRINRINKPTTPSQNLTPNQKAAIRAIRHEARQFAKATPYVPKPRTKRAKTKQKPAQTLTSTETHTKTAANTTEAGAWAAKGYRWYTSLLGFSVFTPLYPLTSKTSENSIIKQC